MLAVLSRLTGYTLIWVEDRQEHLVASAQARDQLHHTRMAVDVDGRILAWEDDFVVDIGAGSLWVAGIVANTAIHLLGPTGFRSTHQRTRRAHQQDLVAQYRGAGRPEATFALERTLDAAALELGISPAEIRRRNLLTANDMPYPRPIPYRDGVPISLTAVITGMPGIRAGVAAGYGSRPVRRSEPRLPDRIRVGVLP
jgi:carbon-monoxide dehydrogenase large subunit